MFEYSDFVRFLASFIIVVILIYSIYYAVNRYWKGLLPGQKGLISIIDIKYLGKNKGFAIVRANNRYYFFSFDEKNISIIEKWESLEESQNLPEKSNEKKSDSS